GYRFDGDGSQELYGHAFLLPEFGPNWRKRVREEIPYYFTIEAQGECLPREQNYVKLDAGKQDAWGIPVLHINASYGENENAMAIAMREHIDAIMDAMNLSKLTRPRNQLRVFGKKNKDSATGR